MGSGAYVQNIEPKPKISLAKENSLWRFDGKGDFLEIDKIPANRRFGNLVGPIPSEAIDPELLVELPPPTEILFDASRDWHTFRGNTPQSIRRRHAFHLTAIYRERPVDLLKNMLTTRMYDRLGQVIVYLRAFVIGVPLGYKQGTSDEPVLYQANLPIFEEISSYLRDVYMRVGEVASEAHRATLEDSFPIFGGNRTDVLGRFYDNDWEILSTTYRFEVEAWLRRAIDYGYDFKDPVTPDAEEEVDLEDDELAFFHETPRKKIDDRVMEVLATGGKGKLRAIAIDDRESGESDSEDRPPVSPSPIRKGSASKSLLDELRRADLGQAGPSLRRLDSPRSESFPEIGRVGAQAPPDSIQTVVTYATESYTTDEARSREPIVPSVSIPHRISPVSKAGLVETQESRIGDHSQSSYIIENQLGLQEQSIEPSYARVEEAEDDLESPSAVSSSGKGRDVKVMEVPGPDSIKRTEAEQFSRVIGTSRSHITEPKIRSSLNTSAIRSAFRPSDFASKNRLASIAEVPAVITPLRDQAKGLSPLSNAKWPQRRRSQEFAKVGHPGTGANSVPIGQSNEGDAFVYHTRTQVDPAAIQSGVANPILSGDADRNPYRIYSTAIQTGGAATGAPIHVSTPITSSGRPMERHPRSGATEALRLVPADFGSNHATVGSSPSRFNNNIVVHDNIVPVLQYQGEAVRHDEGSDHFQNYGTGFGEANRVREDREQRNESPAPSGDFIPVENLRSWGNGPPGGPPGGPPSSHGDPFDGDPHRGRIPRGSGWPIDPPRRGSGPPGGGPGGGPPGGGPPGGGGNPPIAGSSIGDSNNNNRNQWIRVGTTGNMAKYISTREVHFDPKLKPESIPSWDGDEDELFRWLLELNSFAERSESTWKQLGDIAPLRLRGVAQKWWYSLPSSYRNMVSENWDSFKAEIRTYWMDRAWIARKRIEAERHRYRDPDNRDEKPSEYYIRKKEAIAVVYEWTDMQIMDEILKTAPTMWIPILQPSKFNNLAEFQTAIKYHEADLLRIGESDPEFSTKTSRPFGWRNRGQKPAYDRPAAKAKVNRVESNSKPGVTNPFRKDKPIGTNSISVRPPKFKKVTSVKSDGKTPKEVGARGCITCGGDHWDRECVHHNHKVKVMYAYTADDFAAEAEYERAYESCRNEEEPTKRETAEESVEEDDSIDEEDESQDFL
jgi:hypothetical protein